ncbi:MAG TPA: hypothetical protein VFD26_11275 [Methyloceanibacter sp.]|nr:hypothetical protein [Methyloceanibacter sp.]
MVARRKPDIIGAAPIKTDAGTVALGREAWARRKEADRASWDDWKLVGEALLVGKQEAMRAAKTNRPCGRKYTEFFSAWTKRHDFGGIDPADRSKLIKIMENLDEVEARRNALPPEKRAQLNHPSSVWRDWKCPRRGNSGKPRGNGVGTTRRRGEAQDQEQTEVDWGNLLLRANKAAGDTSLEELWPTSEPPDRGVITAVRRAANAWHALADYLESIADATPEELAEARESYASGQRTNAEAEAKAEARSARWREEAEHAWGAAG